MSTANDTLVAPTAPPSIQIDPNAGPHDKLMQGLNQGGVPVVAPDGHPGFVHRDALNDFLGKNPGYKTGAVVTAPDGHPGVVPHDAIGDFLKSNPDYQIGQATPQTDAVLQDPRLNESRTDMLKRTVVQPFKDEMAPKSAWEEIKRDIARGLNPLSNPVVQAAGNLVTEGGQKLSDLIAHEWEGVSPDTTIGKLGKNYLAPAAETAATGVLAPMAQPESIATMGAFKAPVAGTAGRLIRAGTGLAFGVPALRAAVKSGAPAVQAASQGNTPEAVRLGTQAAFDTALAAETLGGVAREAPATAKETAQLATNKAPYWLAKRLPESLLTPAKQVAVDVRQTQDQGANLAAGLETGGSPTSKSVQTYEDVAQPILPDIRAEAARQGVTEKDFEGRKGYDTAQKVTEGVRQTYDDAYNSLLDPLRGDYAGEAARRAAGEVVNKMLGDSTLMDEIQKGDPSGRNVQALRNLRDSIANVRTVGQLDDMRQALNRLSGKYEARSEGQQYLSPLTQETLHEGANSIRNALYGEMERLYGGGSTPTEVNQGQVQNPAVQSGVTESQIRELQRNHGAAIQADDLMKQTARKLSAESSKAAAPATYWQRIRGSAAPLEMAGRPQMAATEFFRSILGFKPPDATEVFNTQMKRVIKGAAPHEGMDFPRGATTPEYVEGRSEGPTSSRVPGLALPAPTPFADAEVVGPRGPQQLEGAGIDQRALPAGAYEQPPSRFTPKPKALPPATLPAENAPRTNRVEAVGVPETAEASALQNRFEQKPRGFTPPKRPFFLKSAPDTGEQPPSQGVEPTKQPWEMTRNEYLQAVAQGRMEPGSKFAQALANAENTKHNLAIEQNSFRKVIGAHHDAAVTIAAAQGKTIPPSVLADYPSLAADVAKKSAPPQSVPAVQAAVKSQVAPAETPASPAVGSAEYEDLKARVAQLEQKRSGKGIVGVLTKPHREVIPTGTQEYSSTQRIATPTQEGHTTKLLTSSGELPAQYAVVEASTLRPSHDPMTFARNPEYPPGVQERAYDTSKEAQQRVISQAQNYEPMYTVNTNPDAVNGPPVIMPDGTVLGGNSRAMSTVRLYKSGNAEKYRDALLSRAREFGISQPLAEDMKEPVLVRQLTKPPANIDEMRALASELNKSMTGALGVSERAVSAGKSISRETLNSIAGILDNLGDGATLRDAMREKGGDIVSLLVKDGAITPRERPQYVDTATGGLSEEGKTFVEKALLGSVVDDPRLMDRAPKSTLNKLDTSLAALSSLAPRTDAYNILPLIRQALAEHADIANSGMSVEDHLAQGSMFGSARNPAVDALTRLLGEKPTAVKSKLRQFSQDANFDQQGQASLLTTEQPSPANAFNAAFGTKLTDDQLDNFVAEAAGNPIMQGSTNEQGIQGESEARSGSLQRASTTETPSRSSERTPAPEAQPEEVNPSKHFLAKLTAKPEPEYLNNGFGPKRTPPPADVEAIKSRIAELEAKKAKPSSRVPALQAAARSSPAERFRSMADALDKQIDDKRREMTQNATPKRMAQYRSRIIEADELERTQKALRALADAHEKGTVPPELAGLRTKDEIARMVHKGLSGEGGYYDRIPNRDYHDKSPAGKKLQDMIEGKTPEANAARAEKDRLSKISQAEADAQFRPIPGFFPTPKPIIEKMLNAADIRPGEKVLEPSAGKGDIADAIKQKTPGDELEKAEINGQLANILKLKGHKLVASDFLSEAFDNDKGKYDKIVMNPPFEKGQDVDHVRRAYELLKPGGRLVSIMSPHAEFANDKKSADFRNWLDRVGGTSEKIENGFKGAGVFRQTGVASRMVVIDKE